MRVLFYCSSRGWLVSFHEIFIYPMLLSIDYNIFNNLCHPDTLASKVTTFLYIDFEKLPNIFLNYRTFFLEEVKATSRYLKDLNLCPDMIKEIKEYFGFIWKLHR